MPLCIADNEDKKTENLDEEVQDKDGRKKKRGRSRGYVIYEPVPADEEWETGNVVASKILAS